MSKTDGQTIDYQDAGVNIDAGNELVKRIGPLVKQTLRPEVLGNLGGFAGLFELPTEKYRKPVLVACTDGVGTKLKLAQQFSNHGGIGIDLVAMCANDLIVMGAEPLFFLDYYASAALDVELAANVIAGIAKGCKQAGMALIGGETAEMPGMYQSGDYDLAGFCVGIVEKGHIISGQSVKAGDQIIGLTSSGAHANGYSLIRKILDDNKIDAEQIDLAGQKLSDCLMAPTRIYVKSLQPLFAKHYIAAAAHITGGGLLENLPRVLSDNLQAKINTNSWPRPALFQWLAEQGPLTDATLWRTFNAGIGMALVVEPEHVDKALTELKKQDETAYHIGEICKRADNADSVVFVE